MNKSQRGKLNVIYLFFFNDTATTEIYTLSLHDALPISSVQINSPVSSRALASSLRPGRPSPWNAYGEVRGFHARSEEHTSELQSQSNLVCRLLLEKKKKTNCGAGGVAVTTRPAPHSNVY